MAWKSFKMNGTRWAIERKHILEYLLRKNASRSATFFVQSGLGTKFFLFVLSYPIWWVFSSGSAVKKSPAMREMQVRSLGGEDPLEEDPMDRGAWWVMVHRVPQSQTWLKQQQQKHCSVWLSYRDLNLDPTFWVILSIAPHWKKNW